MTSLLRFLTLKRCKSERIGWSVLIFRISGRVSIDNVQNSCHPKTFRREVFDKITLKRPKNMETNRRISLASVPFDYDGCIC